MKHELGDAQFGPIFSRQGIEGVSRMALNKLLVQNGIITPETATKASRFVGGLVNITKNFFLVKTVWHGLKTLRY